MKIEFEVSQVIPAGPEQIYKAWLDTEGHTGMTGSLANVTDCPGEEFDAWDG